MDVNTDDISAFLNLAWQKAGDAANTLPAQLLAEQQAALAFVTAGSLATVSKNSTSQSYAFYGPGTFTHRQITSIFTKLIRVEKETRNAILKAALRDGVTIAADFDLDPAVKDIMERYFGISTEATQLPDITELRFPKCSPPVACIA